ncbi:phosphotransferase [Cohnella sp. CFH 77786]|nr:phosphotransferase [Cohnella sp. CFH 77786]
MFTRRAGWRKRRNPMDVQDIPVEIVDQIGAIQNLSFPRQGYTSLVAKIQTRDHQFIIKKTEHALFNEWLSEEYLALQYLSTTGLPVPKPYAFHIQDRSRWLLMDYIDGISLRHYLGSKPDLRDREKVISHYGLCLKKIHESQCPVELRKNDQSWLDTMLMKASRNLTNYHVEGTEELLIRLKNNRPKPIENTLIHGDFHTNNVLVNNNKVIGIIDWPRAAFGDPRFDIALAIRPKQDVFDQEGDQDVFFESYGRVRITDEEYRYFQEGLYKFF